MSRSPGAPTSAMLEWATSGVALGDAGEIPVSGDLHVVAPFADGVLVAAIDGLGHGAEAAMAARAAAELLEAYASDSVVELIRRCHEGLRKTRGAVMSLASFRARDALVTWTGVGNVEGVLLRVDRTARREALTVRGGVVGYQLPPLRMSVLPVSPGDTLILTTDGIRSGFTDELVVDRSPQEIAESILATHGKQSDDCLVLVARYLGLSS